MTKLEAIGDLGFFLLIIFTWSLIIVALLKYISEENSNEEEQ